MGGRRTSKSGKSSFVNFGETLTTGSGYRNRMQGGGVLILREDLIVVNQTTAFSATTTMSVLILQNVVDSILSRNTYVIFSEVYQVPFFNPQTGVLNRGIWKGARKGDGNLARQISSCFTTFLRKGFCLSF